MTISSILFSQNKYIIFILFDKIWLLFIVVQSMEKLIVKGGFRERANRNRKYHQSENQQTSLEPHGYRKSTAEEIPTVPVLEVNKSLEKQP